MLLLSPTTVVIAFICVVSTVHWLWRRSKCSQYPLPQPGHCTGFFVLLCPLFNEIGFIIYCWWKAHMD
ncbi:hypothetical protein BIW11_12213, partial [Tropilaelaps mercedesae]